MSGIIGGAGSKSGVIGTTELDYEVGTWTPTYPTGDSAWNWTTSHNNYLKIGNMCQISIKMDLNGVGTSNNTAFPNLPFQTKNGETYMGSIMIKNLEAENYNQYCCFVSTNTFYVYHHAQTGGWGALGYNDVDTDTEWYATVSYITA